MPRRSKNGTLKEERTYNQFRKISTLIARKDGEYSSTIEILQKIAKSSALNSFAIKYSYEWFAKAYSLSDLIVAFADTCTGEIIRKYTQKINPQFLHPKARLIIERNPTEGLIPHTFLKRINQFQQLCTTRQENKKIIQQNSEDGFYQEFSVTDDGKYISSTGPAKTIKCLAGIAVLLWYLYEKDPRGPNFGYSTIQLQDTVINFFKVDNTKSLWTLDPKFYARLNKSDQEQQRLSNGIKTNNWFIDTLIDYMPDHLHFYHMDPRIFSSPDFKNEMHEMILHILLNPARELIEIFKNHYPDGLLEEKIDDECDESSLESSYAGNDDESEDKKEPHQSVSLVEFDKQIIRIILCLIARKNQLFDWASKEPEFIAFLNSKELSVKNILECIEKDNQDITRDLFSSHNYERNKIALSENMIKYDEIVDLFDLQGFPAILKNHIVFCQSIPNIVLKWRNKNQLNDQTEKPNLVTSPLKQSPIKNPISSPRKLTYVAVLNEDNAHQLVSLPGALFAYPASPKGVPVSVASLTNNPVAPSSPSCKRQIKFEDTDGVEMKQARLQSSVV